MKDEGLGFRVWGSRIEVGNYWQVTEVKHHVDIHQLFAPHAVSAPSHRKHLGRRQTPPCRPPSPPTPPAMLLSSRLIPPTSMSQIPGIATDRGLGFRD
eukprot:2065902-Rhodomonas_salina.5